MKGLILAAGAATRFGGDKNIFFMDRNINALRNVNCKQIGIVTNIDNYDLYKKEYNDSDIEIIFQPKVIYGTGGALLASQYFVKDDSFYVLFGDNYVSELKVFDNLKPNGAMASYRKFEANKDNLRLSYIDTQDYIIHEKPHDKTEGTFFVGYMVFGNKMWETFSKLEKSTRNEYEITQVYNLADNRNIFELNCEWVDITTREDLKKIKKLI